MENKPKTSTVQVWLQQTRDIEKFAKDNLGIELMPHQLDFIDALAAGKTLYFGRLAGRKTAKHVLQEYVNQTNGYIKHFKKTHFAAVTIDGKPFVYCPIGNICSWSQGDYNNKWCHYCKKHFSELEIERL